MLILSYMLMIFAQAEAFLHPLQDIYNTFTNPPDTTPSVPPAELSVQYFTETVKPGNIISPYDAVFPPYISYEASPNALYTLAAVDPDTPSYSSSFDKESINILIVNIPGSNISSGDNIVRYIAPNPYPGSGYHRFFFLLYKQQDHIDVKTDYFVALARKLTNFSISAFAKEFNLGKPIAANYFRSQHTISMQCQHEKQCS